MFIYATNINIIFSVAFFRYVVRVAGSQAMTLDTIVYLVVQLCFALWFLAFIPTIGGAVTEDTPIAWEPESGIGYAAILAQATALGICLCSRPLSRISYFCVKRAGHKHFCKELWRGSVAAQQPQREQEPEHILVNVPPQPLLVFGVQKSLTGSSNAYQIMGRDDKQRVVKLPCSVCGKQTTNQRWHRVVQSSAEGAIVQSLELGSNLLCCEGLRFQMGSTASLVLIHTQMKWPIHLATCPQPSLDLLVCCHKCFQIKPPSVLASVTPTSIPRSPTKEELCEQVVALTAQAKLNEPLLQELDVLKERLGRARKGVDPLLVPNRLKELADRREFQRDSWKGKLFKIKPAVDQFNRFLNAHGSVKDVQTLKAEAKRLRAAVQSASNFVEQVPQLRKQIIDLETQLSALQVECVETAETASLLEQLKTDFASKSQEMVQEMFDKVAAADERNERTEGKLEKMEVMYQEVCCSLHMCCCCPEGRTKPS